MSDEKTKEQEQEVEVTVDASEAVQAIIDEKIDGKINHLSVQIEGFSKSLNALMEGLEKAPALNAAGYKTDDGGSADPEHKSFGDFLLAVWRGDNVRLTKVYKSTKAAMAEGTGATGGFLVPDDFQARLMEVAAPMAVVRPRATVIPVSAPRGFVPSLNQFDAPTKGVGDSAYAGGVTVAETAENAALTETEPTLEQIEYNINKIGGYSYVSNELMADSPMAIEALLTRIYAKAIAAKEDYYFFRGAGVNEPLGILNAPAAIGVAPDTNSNFGIDDAVEMLSRFQPQGGAPAWYAHRETLLDLSLFFNVNTGGVDWVQPREGEPGNLLGYPLIWSEHLPQTDNAGHIILADLSAYLIFDREGLSIAFSEHFDFDNDRGTWRFTKRLDGQPWLASAITLADPQGSYTVSPFVYFND